MNCPPNIASILSEILQTGLLQIRVAGWQGDSNLAAEIADHLHNLPNLLLDFSQPRLTYYWEAERAAFQAGVDESIAKPYTDLWERLEPLVYANAESEKAQQTGVV